jgi:Bacterial membrane protein YfhO
MTNDVKQNNCLVQDATGLASNTPSEAAGGSGQSETRWDRTDSYVLMGLVGLGLLVFAQLWLPDVILVKRDAFRLFLPLKQYMHERLAAGQLPQWFPYEGLGRPFIGIPVTGVFHPFTLLYWLMPVHEAYRFSTLLACLAAVTGMYCLGRRLRYSRVGAVAASAIILCSGYMFSLTENLVYLYSFAMLPFFCLCLERMADGHGRWVAAGALVWASIFLNGDIQTGYYYGFIAMAWGFSRGSQPWARTACLLAGLACLTVLVAGVQLGPSWAVHIHSDRASGTGFHEQAVYWSTHPLRLFTLIAGPVGLDEDHNHIAASYFGSFRPGRPACGYWAESLYLGLPAVVLAWMGVKARRDLRFVSILGGVALILAMGKYAGLYEVAYRTVPLWSAFRYPERLIAIVTFVVSLYAGAGIESLRRDAAPIWPWMLIALVCFGLSGLFFLMQDNSWLTAMETSPGLGVRFAQSVSLAWLYSAGAGLGVGLILLLVKHQKVSTTAGLCLLTVLAVMDLCRGNSQVISTGPAESWTFSPSLAQAIHKDSGVDGPGHFRVYTFTERQIKVDMPPSLVSLLGSKSLDSIASRQSLHVELNAPFHLESIRAYLPGLSDAYVKVGEMHSLEMGARYNVSYLIGRRYHFENRLDMKNIVSVLPEYDLTVIRNPLPVKSRAYLSVRPEPVGGGDDLLDRMERQDFLSGEVDLIENGEEALLPASDKALVSMEQYADENVRIQVSTPRPVVLVLLDSYAPGWRAVLEDGRQLPIRRANGFVRSVVVPEGSHTIQFSYQTPYLIQGALTSCVGLGVTFLFIFRRKRSNPLSSKVPGVAP